MRPAAVALALLAGLLASSATGASFTLVVSGEDGRRLWTLPVLPGDEVVLAYTHSIYLAPAEEHLTVLPDGLALREVRSPSEAVLAYNGLAVAAPVGGVYAAAASARLPDLVLRIGQTGRQRLVVAGRVIPLHRAGVGARLRVWISRR